MTNRCVLVSALVLVCGVSLSVSVPTTVNHSDKIDVSKIKVTFESCKASLDKLAPAMRKKTLPEVRWVHIPKAGTSFAAALYAYVCKYNKENASAAQDPKGAGVDGKKVSVGKTFVM
jgi:hypothetical protein